MHNYYIPRCAWIIAIPSSCETGWSKPSKRRRTQNTLRGNIIHILHKHWTKSWFSSSRLPNRRLATRSLHYYTDRLTRVVLRPPTKLLLLGEPVTFTDREIHYYNNKSGGQTVLAILIIKKMLFYLYYNRFCLARWLKTFEGQPATIIIII